MLLQEELKLDKWLTLTLVSAENYEEYWPAARRLLLDAKHTWEEFATLDIIHNWIVNNVMQLWIVHGDEEGIRLALLTEFYMWPKVKMGRIRWIAGEGLDQALPLLDAVEMWMKRHGAQKVEIIGRRGWERKLKPYGYEFHSVCLHKNLEELKEH